jgi:pyruvate formate lyase activating enzyme
VTGRIVETKRFAIHDGPGIRTTVFLKGCPLACRWCHNPETISRQPEIGFLRQKCVACGRCVATCPTGAHAVTDGTHTLDRSRCTACGACVEACLPGALELYGREVTLAEVIAEVVEDRTFYEQSGGGVTLSGGEPLLQAEFCAAVCRQLRESGIHCAVDTSGAVPWDRFETVLPYVDLFLYDLKHMDDAQHRLGTGTGNRLILENLRQLSERGRAIEIRLPLVPGFNDDPQNLQALAEYLLSLPATPPLRLLPYHNLAHSKYEAVGRLDDLPPTPASADGIATAIATLRTAGIEPLV